MCRRTAVRIIACASLICTMAAGEERYHWSQVTVYDGGAFPVGKSRDHGNAALARHRWNLFPADTEKAEAFLSIASNTVSIRFDAGVQTIAEHDRERFLSGAPTQLANGMVVRFSASPINSIGLPTGDLYIMSPTNTITSWVRMVKLPPATMANGEGHKNESNKTGGR